MATIREQIVVKALQKVNTGTPGGVPQTERARTFALSPEQLMSSIVYGKSEENLSPGQRRAAVQTHVILHFEIRAKNDATNGPDVLLDPVVNWIIKALAGTFEPGLWEDVDYLDTELDFAQADYGFCLATVRLRVKSQIRANDPSLIA